MSKSKQLKSCIADYSLFKKIHYCLSDYSFYYYDYYTYYLQQIYTTLLTLVSVVLFPTLTNVVHNVYYHLIYCCMFQFPTITIFLLFYINLYNYFMLDK